MVFNSLMLASVASASAEAWQWAACMPERLSDSQLLDLLFFFPLNHLSLFICTFLCFPSPHYYFDDSSSSSSSAVDFNDFYYHSHSD